MQFLNQFFSLVNNFGIIIRIYLIKNVNLFLVKCQFEKFYIEIKMCKRKLILILMSVVMQVLTIETGMGPPVPFGYGYGDTR